MSYSLIYFNTFSKGGPGMAREFVFLTSRMCEIFLPVSLLYNTSLPTLASEYTGHMKL